MAEPKLRGRGFLSVGVAVSLLMLAAALSGSNGDGTASAAAPARPQPNILVVMTDDQTVESMRVMRNVQDLLAAQGTTFANNFATYPLCCPSRATFLTGQYPHNHTVMSNALPTGGFEKLDHSNTLPVWLQRGGYHTVHVGKYLNGYGRRNPREIPAGWSEWYGSVDPSTYNFYNYTLNENGKLVKYGADARSYQADVYARMGSEIIRRRAPQPQPFFLSVAFLAPHSGGPRESDDPRNFATPVPAPRHRNLFATQPLPTPPSFNEADVVDKPMAMRSRPLLTSARVAAITENYRQRLESLLAVDEAVAELVRALTETGELANTLIVFTADNGFFHGEHRVPSGKVLVYEPSIRVPLILRGPGIPAGQVRPQLAGNIDLAPTIAAAAGVTPLRKVDGRSLLPIASDRLLHSGRDVLLETPTYSAIHTPRHVYVEHRTGEQELYDLERDPDQLTSRHGDPAYARLKTDLAARLARLRACSGSACRRGPGLRFRLRYRPGRAPDGGPCARSNVRAIVSGPAASQLAEVRFLVESRGVARDASAPFSRVIPRRFLSTSERSTVRALAALEDSRRVTLSWRLRACPR